VTKKSPRPWRSGEQGGKQMVQTGATAKPGDLERRYLERTPRSKEIQARAERVMPGGETRSLFFPPYPLTLDRGQGARCWDVDGNEYMDLGNNYTVLIHGHRYPPIMEAVAKQLEKGNTWAAKALPQVELAELLVDRFDGVDKVRYSSTGTEAVLTALAVARGYTGRKKILFSRYSFHGYLLEPSRRTHAPIVARADTGGEVNNPYDTSGAWLDCYLGDFGDAESFERILEEHGHEICCVMLEPVLGLGGCVTAPPSFFERVKAAAHKAGALFILDEATVHRISPGGAQRKIGVTGDVSVLGKLVGGGFPCGTIGGADEFMKGFDPRTGNVLVSGTFSGNPVSMTAGVQAISHFTEAAVERMERQMDRIEAGLHAAAQKNGLPFSTRRAGNLMNLFFQDEPPPVCQLRTDQKFVDRFQLACCVNGLFVVTRICINTSSVLTEAEVEEIIQRGGQAMADLANDL
jgi:glutamate-1-semialdehyde 2,1-aminomutase